MSDTEMEFATILLGSSNIKDPTIRTEIIYGRVGVFQRPIVLFTDTSNYVNQGTRRLKLETVY